MWWASHKSDANRHILTNIHALSLEIHYIDSFFIGTEIAISLYKQFKV